MELSPQIRLFLLKAIDKNGNIAPLKEIGYEYSQIVRFINSEIEVENAGYVNGELKLTSKGKQLLLSLEQAKMKKGSSAWIEPENQSKVSKLKENEIFLPNQNFLFFD